MYPKNIKIESTNKVLSSHAGLIFFENLWDQLNLTKKLRRLLPRKKKKRGIKQINKFKGLLFSFTVGNDCIDDLEELRADALFNELIEGELPARTAGDFLSAFHNRQVEMIQDILLDVALSIRMALFDDNKFILSMDSTPHQQWGKKMEGVSKNYKGIIGLDSQNVYDQYGISYLFDLRPGNTFSGNEAERWIYKIFSKVTDSMEKYFRADSAYGNQDVYSSLVARSVKFTIVLKNNIGKYIRKKNYLVWRKTELEFFDSTECEISTAWYPVEKLGQFRVVFIRKRKSDDEIEKQLELFEEYIPEEDDYKHYSIITNISYQEMNEEEIIEFYRGRANCENYIKEQKYGYDFLNFPCKKLTSNKVWGLIGTFAHNMMRYLSFCMDQKIKRVRGKDKVVRTVIQKGYFAKKVRNTLIKIPCQVVRSARRIKLKINFNQKEVIDKLMWKIKKNNLSKVYQLK